VLRAHGVPLTVEMCRETKGRYVSEAVRHWHDRLPVGLAGIDEVVAHILDVLDELIATSLELKPGVLHAIGECRDRELRIAVASSAPLRIITSVLARFGLGGYFDSVSRPSTRQRASPIRPCSSPRRALSMPSLKDASCSRTRSQGFAQRRRRECSV